MAHQDFEDAFEELRAPIQKIGGLYSQAGEAVDAAAAINDDGSVTVDYGAMQKALDILPEGDDERIDRATARLDQGFALLDKQPLAPWSAFTDAQAIRPLGQEFWRALGFRSAARSFREMENVPPEVTEPTNMAMLEELASKAPNYAEFARDPATDLMPAWAGRVLYLSPQHASHVVVPPPDDTSTSTQALKPEDFKASIECLQRANYRFVHFGFTLEICLDSACADVLEDLLSFGVGALFGAGGAVLTAGFSSAAVGAAVASVGGWVAFFIMISAAYWALMIHLNKTPRGVCLYIPMPWTFGIIGPGWAVGR
jgi:hypothetical protein